MISLTDSSGRTLYGGGRSLKCKATRDKKWGRNPKQAIYHLDAEAERRVRHSNRRHELVCCNYANMVNDAARVNNDSYRKAMRQAHLDKELYEQIAQFCEVERIRRKRTSEQLWRDFEKEKLRSALQNMRTLLKRNDVNDIVKETTQGDLEDVMDVLHSNNFRYEHGRKILIPEAARVKGRKQATTNLAREISVLQLRSERNKINFYEDTERYGQLEEGMGIKLPKLKRRKWRTPLNSAVVPFVTKLKRQNPRVDFLIRSDSAIIDLDSSKSGLHRNSLPRPRTPSPLPPPPPPASAVSAVSGATKTPRAVTQEAKPGYVAKSTTISAPASSSPTPSGKPSNRRSSNPNNRLQLPTIVEPPRTE